MILESTYDPNSDFTILFTSLLFLSIGVGIALIIALLFKKYNIDARVLFTGQKRPREAELGEPGSLDKKGDDF